MARQITLGKVKGDDATINGYNAITLTANSHIEMTHNDNAFNIGIPAADWASKQDTISGTEGQIVGFDSQGKPTAVNAAYKLFGFEMDEEETNPASKIRYIEQNSQFTPFTMNMATGVPDYGDWDSAWFIKDLKPCVLNYDGTVAYELNKNDYTKKTDGTASNVADDSIGGNVMVGIPTVYIKYVKVSSTKWRAYFSNIPLDGDFKAWAHTGDDGIVKPYVYLPAYNGWKDANDRLRSISGKNPTRSTTAQNELDYTANNNPLGGTVTGWGLETLSQRMLINMLLLLIGKNCDTQGTFGQGNSYGYYDDPKPADKDANGVLITGTMDDKGLFYGVSAENLGVKVFGIENWWGNIWRRTAGLINDNGAIKIKLTKSTVDGSSVSSYSINPLGYIDISSYTPPIQASASPILTMSPVQSYGVFISGITATDSYGYKDCYWTNNAQVNFALFGGDSIARVRCGAFACDLIAAAGISDWDIGGAPSFL